jgi:hypothetical protein
MVEVTILIHTHSQEIKILLTKLVRKGLFLGLTYAVHIKKEPGAAFFARRTDVQ